MSRQTKEMTYGDLIETIHKVDTRPESVGAFPVIYVPPPLIQLLRTIPLPYGSDPTRVSLFKMLPNLYLSKCGMIPEHTDTHPPDWSVFGIVLLNDPNLKLIHDGMAYSIPTGTIYNFDGTKPHSVASEDWTFPMKRPYSRRFAFFATPEPPGQHSLSTYIEFVNNKMIEWEVSLSAMSTKIQVTTLP